MQKSLLSLLLACLISLASCSNSAVTEQRNTQNRSPVPSKADVGDLKTQYVSSRGLENDDAVPTKPLRPAELQESDSLLIALDADMTAGTARSGEAIRRGLVAAIHVLNQRGGLLGRHVELTVRDHRGNPDRGVDHILEFAEMPNLLAVFGGVHTPVAIKQLPSIHEHELLFLIPWAAGTPIVSNGYEPNFVFRVSARDEYVGEFLVGKAIQRGLTRPALVLEDTPWGRSSDRALRRALAENALAPVCTEWLHWGERNLSSRLRNVLTAKPDCILLVCNPPEGAPLMHALLDLPSQRRLPIISHWGISGTDFVRLTDGAACRLDLRFMQTKCLPSELKTDLARQLVSTYTELFDDANTARDIFCPPGTVHAWELVHLLEQAVNRANSLDRPSIRSAMESLPPFSGTLKYYAAPFTSSRHDALLASDLLMARFAEDGSVQPIILDDDE